VHLVLDNSSTHKPPAIQRWLAAHARFALPFTPTSSSWPNLVERWSAEMTSCGPSSSTGASRPRRALTRARTRLGLLPQVLLRDRSEQRD
jgi:hypothetical protein